MLNEYDVAYVSTAQKLHGSQAAAGFGALVKVLLVADSYPPLVGGGTRATQQLAHQLHNRGHDVAVITAWQRGTPSYELDNGVAVHRLRGVVSRLPMLSADPTRDTPPPFPDPELAWRIRRVVQGFAPDVVHAYGWLTYSCRLALRRSSTPVILAARDYGNICSLRTLIEHLEGDTTRICDGPQWSKCIVCAGRFYGHPKGFVAAAAILTQRRWLERRVSALHVVSTYCRDSLDRSLLRHHKPRVEVLPDFRDAGRDAPPAAAILSELPDSPFILFVGAFRRVKGDQLLIDAYARLHDPPPLVMVGGQSAETLPQPVPGVKLLVDVPHGTVMEIWARALFGVCPSMLPETLGNTVHEGMSRGKAVIGTYPGGHQDMITNGVDGILVPAGDLEALVEALELLLSAPDLRDRLGAAAQTAARAFTPEAVMPRLEAMLEDVAAARLG
jgi:glycosyltransferase involved in cell wall biosynthesis